MPDNRADVMIVLVAPDSFIYVSPDDGEKVAAALIAGTPRAIEVTQLPEPKRTVLPLTSVLTVEFPAAQARGPGASPRGFAGSARPDAGSPRA
jgi:hypothetical protein